MRNINQINAEMGARIKERRIAINMTQDELAERLNYKHKSSISMIEHGKTGLYVLDLFKLAKVLDVDPAYILGTESLTEEGTMTFGDVLESGLIKDNHKVKLIINEDNSILRETWRGNWYEDKILEHSSLDVVQIIFDQTKGWQIFLRGEK